MPTFDELMELAIKGDSNAQWMVGVICSLGKDLNGNEIKKDLAQAEYWLKKSADQGNAQGQLHLGLYYSNVDDYINAVHWLKKADAQGRPEAKEALELAQFFLKAQKSS